MINLKHNKKILVLIIALILLVFVLFFTSVFKNCRKSREQEEQISSMQSEISSIEDENSKLSETLEHGEDESYIEKIARDEYSYVKPEERVYYDSDAS